MFSAPIRLLYKGEEEDVNFIVYITSPEKLDMYREDPEEMPLVHVVETFKIFVVDDLEDRSSIMREAPNVALQTEFGTHHLEECLREIVERGVLMEVDLEGGEKGMGGPGGYIDAGFGGFRV